MRLTQAEFWQLSTCEPPSPSIYIFFLSLSPFHCQNRSHHLASQCWEPTGLLGLKACNGIWGITAAPDYGWRWGWLVSDKTDSWEDSREQICWYRGRDGARDSNVVDVAGRKTLQRQWDASESGVKSWEDHWVGRLLAKWPICVHSFSSLSSPNKSCLSSSRI